MRIGEELQTAEHLNFNHSAVCRNHWKFDRYCAGQVDTSLMRFSPPRPVSGRGGRGGEG